MGVRPMATGLRPAAVGVDAQCSGFHEDETHKSPTFPFIPE